MQNREGVKVLKAEDIQIIPTGREWHIEVFEDLQSGNKGLLVGTPNSDYCFIIPTDIPSEEKLTLLETNEKLPKYLKRYLERVFRKEGI